jgi:hypothetical protein
LTGKAFQDDGQDDWENEVSKAILDLKRGRTSEEQNPRATETRENGRSKTDRVVIIITGNN